jgi:hypothetical protein
LGWADRRAEKFLQGHLAYDERVIGMTSCTPLVESQFEQAALARAGMVVALTDRAIYLVAPKTNDVVPFPFPGLWDVRAIGLSRLRLELDDRVVLWEFRSMELAGQVERAYAKYCKLADDMWTSHNEPSDFLDLVEADYRQLLISGRSVEEVAALQARNVFRQVFDQGKNIPTARAAVRRAETVLDRLKKELDLDSEPA